VELLAAEMASSELGRVGRHGDSDTALISCSRNSSGGTQAKGGLPGVFISSKLIIMD
jgi:hypothetical protein